MEIKQKGANEVALRTRGPRDLVQYDGELYMVIGPDPDYKECMLVYPLEGHGIDKPLSWGWHTPVLPVKGTLEWELEV